MRPRSHSKVFLHEESLVVIASFVCELGTSESVRKTESWRANAGQGCSIWRSNEEEQRTTEGSERSIY